MAFAQAGLSPLTRQYLHDLQSGQAAAPSCLFKKGNDNHVYVGSLIKVSNEQDAMSGLKAIGAHVGTKAGNIWTVQVPVDQVAAFAKVKGIAYIQMDEPVHPKLNVARKTTRVDSVQSGFGLAVPYSGKDVVMGVIDFGFDYNHPTFYDTLGTRYRIKRVWEMNGTGTPPAGYTYGNEITDTTQIKAHGTDDARQMHGTSTAGIAAGSGYGSPNNNRYRGMAYETDIVMVGVRRDSIEKQWQQGGFSDFIDGINYIFNYAQSVQKPAVVNISWGSQSGPHDGSTLFNEACNNLSGSGRIIVMSAGNEGEEKIHLSKTFTATDTAISSFLDFTPAVYKRTWVDAWGEAGKTFCAKVTLYNNGVAGNTTGLVCIDNQIHNQLLMAANTIDTCYVQFITTQAEHNGKPRITVDVYNRSADSVAVTLQATDGTLHIWNEYYYYGFPKGYLSDFESFNKPWATTGNTASTVSDMGSGEAVLLVGAYASKTNWTNLNHEQLTYNSYVLANKIVPFSSHGPMANGRTSPDIAAPGLTLATSSSSYDASYTPGGANASKVVSAYVQPVSGKTYYYSEFIGTSASAPVASGIVALMLQANPNLFPSHIKSIFAETAITDTYTGTLPAGGDNTWGHGKINAYGAVKLALQKTGIYRFSGQKLDFILYPNPGQGQFSMDYTSDKSEQLSMDVYTISGSKVITHRLEAEAGVNTYTMSFSHLPKGLYIVHLTSSGGSASTRLLIQ